MKKIALFIMTLPLMVACKEEIVPAMSVSTNFVEAKSAGESFDISVTANVNWIATSSAGDWVSVSPASGASNGSLKITVQPNPDFKDRETTVIVKGEGLEKTITVAQEALSLEDVLADSKWQLTDHLTGDSNYDDLKGATINLKKDKSTEVILGITLEGVGTIDKFDGTWSINGSNLVIEGNVGGYPAILLFEIKEPSSKVLKCQLKISLPLLPSDGILVVLTKM